MLNSKQNTLTHETYDNDYLCRLYKRGLKVRVALDRDNFELLSAAYSPCRIIPGNQQPPSGSHQLAAAHQSIAQEALHRFLATHDTFIEIGPNAASFARIAIGKTNPHGCTLRSARDQARHARAAMSNELRGYRPNGTQTLAVQAGGVTHRTLYEHTQHLASGIPTETFCLNGWQNCDAQSLVAVSNHSLYDVPFLDLAVGMRNHNTAYIKAFIHFPTEILDVDEWISAEKGYRFKRDRKTNKVSFSWLSDTAFGYTHDYTTWISYLTTGGFSTPFGFNVIIEKVAWHGSQFELAISKVTAGGIFNFTIPNSLSDLIKVPNFRHIASSGFCKRAFNPKDVKNYIVTDGMKVRKLLDFINARAEKGFSLDVVKAYARTLVSEIRLGDQIAEKRWHCTSMQFSDLCVSIYILSLYQRRLDSHVISKAIEHMDDIKDSFWDDLYCKLRNWFSLDLIHYHREDKKAAQTTRNIFHKATLQFFEDFNRVDTLRDCGFDEEVFFGYNVETLPEIEPTANEILQSKENQPVPEGPLTATTPEWALHFNLPVNQMPGIGPVYLAENQHDILVQECLRGADNEDQPKPLRSVLKTAYDELIKPGNKPDRLHLENMFALTGVPGGAKTGTVICKIIPNSLPQGPVLVLCPTGALADKYRIELKAPSLAATVHAGLRQLEKQKWSLVIIEEAFTLPIAYINFVAKRFKTLLIGDPKQIQHVDFSGLWSGCTMLEALLPAIPRHHINTTKRCPQDVTLLPIIRAAYPGIDSKSPVNASIQWVHSKYTNPQAVNVCFTQLQKNQLQNFAKVNAYTVHECQGQTFPSVILHYSGTAAEENLIKKSPNHLIVGLTRHTNHLYIRDTDGEGLKTFINDKAPLNILADASNIDVKALDIQPKPKDLVIEQTAPDAIPYAFSKSEAGTVEHVLQRYFPTEAPRENISTTSTYLPLGGDAKGVVRISQLGEEEQFESKPHKVYRFKAPQRVMITRNHQKHMLLRTNLERLTHSTKNMAPAVCDKLAKKLFSKVKDEFDWHLPENFHHTCFLEAIDKMQTRGHDLEKLKDIPATEWNDRHTNMVKSFLKAQQKPCLGKNPHTADKAGQGISAWDKTLNILMSPWTRALEQVLVNQSKGRVKVLSQKSDFEVQAILEQDATEGERFGGNDWTQFDSNQNNLTRAILRLALTDIGCPDFLLEAFIDQLESRRICCEVLSLIVNDKKDSGAPHTLIDNCLFNLAICLDIMVDFRYLYIKGDDSLARGPNFRFDHEKMAQYINICGYKFKPEQHTSGSFVSFLVNQQGVAFDLPRMCAKVTSRAYINHEDFVNYQEAVGAQLSKIDLQAGANMCKVNALFYDSTTRSHNRFDILLSFLLRFGRKEINFNELTQHEAIFYKTDSPASNLPHTHIKVKRSFGAKIASAALKLID
nr:non-structural polyprotein [Bastrovirus sp.]